MSPNKNIVRNFESETRKVGVEIQSRTRTGWNFHENARSVR